MTDARVVAVVEKRGRFWAAEPHFPSMRSGEDGRRSRGGRRIVLASNRVYGPGGGTVSAGELVLVQLGGGGGVAAAAVAARAGATAGRGWCAGSDGRMWRGMRSRR